MCMLLIITIFLDLVFLGLPAVMVALSLGIAAGKEGIYSFISKE